MPNEKGFTTAALGFIVFAALVGIIFLTRNYNLSQTEIPSPSPILSSSNPSSPSYSSKPSPTLKATIKPTSSTPSPTPTPTQTTNNSANIKIETTCATNHDNLGNHLDVLVSFEYLDSLNSKDLIISVIDTKTQQRSESHVSLDIANNLTIPAHKYAYAYQGSTTPLELVPDGREYIVRIMKATYKPDNTIDIYTQALEKKFSKQCNY